MVKKVVIRRGSNFIFILILVVILVLAVIFVPKLINNKDDSTRNGGEPNLAPPFSDCTSNFQLKFNSSSTLLKDYSQNNVKSTICSAGLCPKGKVVYNASGKFGGAVSLNGLSYIQIPLYTPGASITMSAWIYPTNLSNITQYSQRALSLWGMWNAGLGIINESGNLTFFRDSGNSCISNIKAVKNTWYHLVGIVNADKTIAFYVNGAKICNALPTANASKELWDSGVLIGVAEAVGQTGRFTGLVDEARVYSRVLSDSEIISVYSQNGPFPNCTNKACGADNGCGGTCLTGTCPTGRVCTNGVCVKAVGEKCCCFKIQGICMKECRCSLDQCCGDYDDVCHPQHTGYC